MFFKYLQSLDGGHPEVWPRAQDGLGAGYSRLDRMPHVPLRAHAQLVGRLEKQRGGWGALVGCDPLQSGPSIALGRLASVLRLVWVGQLLLMGRHVSATRAHTHCAQRGSCLNG